MYLFQEHKTEEAMEQQAVGDGREDRLSSSMMKVATAAVMAARAARVKRKSDREKVEQKRRLRDALKVGTALYS